MFNLLIKEHFKNVASCEKEEHEEKAKLVSNRLGRMVSTQVNRVVRTFIFPIRDCLTYQKYRTK